ncbi:MAG: type II methionyl aminopeptidase [Candidatus Daviesbacteria bacterium]|nr:type II methionyl aminopeptidase [Candidatus Daviesbacteria bacterium]
MTEKQYGGATGRNSEGSSIKKSVQNPISTQKTKTSKMEKENSKSNQTDKQKILKAGKISGEVKEYAKTIIKKGMPLLEIAEKIENKIIELGGKPAFPVNTSINEIAAHYTPSANDSSIAHGLLKVDLGVHIDGWIADTAISFDLENLGENKKLIQASKDALENAIELVSKKIGKKEILTTGEMGEKIQETIESKGFLPIINLSGHQIEQYNLHAGLTIPNIDNKSTEIISPGLYAIEPFVTDGNGKIRDGKPSGIYMLTNPKTPRTPIAREVLEYIGEEYQTLPFCSRWLVKKFGMKTMFALKQLEENGSLHQFPQLVESSNSKVAQTEHTILITEKGVEVTTK